MMATLSPEKTGTGSTTSTYTPLNTPMVKVPAPENHAASVLRPASFTLSPMNQKKLKRETPPSGLLALRVSVQSVCHFFTAK